MHAIEWEDLKGKLDEAAGELLLISVQPPEEYDREHISGSINIPLQTPRFADRVAEIAGNRERTVVLYCADINCDASTKAATELEAEGFTNVYDYEAGIRDWFTHQHAA